MRSAVQVTVGYENQRDDSSPDYHRALIAEVASCHDRDAYQALFCHFGPRIKALMLKSGADHAQAEDLVQDVMVTVWRKVHLYQPDRGTVSSWIFTIARNARIDRIRRSKSKHYDDIDDVELAAESPNAEETTNLSQRAERVSAALEELPPEQREIIVMAYIDDIPQREISKRLDIPLGTVKSRMRLAYGKLRKHLEDVK